MKVVNATDENTVIIMDTENKHCRVEVVMSRDEFHAKFKIPQMPDVKSWTYEPDREMFHTVSQDGVIMAYESASEDPMLKAIQKNEKKIMHEGVNKQLPEHEYKKSKDKWEVPQAILKRKAFIERQEGRMHELHQTISYLFEAVHDMYQAGLLKGTWTPADFDPDLVKKIEAWKPILTEYRADKE